MAALESVLLFDVDASVPHKLLTRATEAGLAAARDALGPEGGADATGRLGSAGEGKRRVRIELRLRAPNAAAGLAAERAFAEAFMAPIRAAGSDVERG